MSQFWKQLQSSRILRMRFLAVQLCRVVDFNIAFWARWTWIWFGHWITEAWFPPFPRWRHKSKLVCLCLLVGWFRGHVWVSCLLRMGLRAPVFDGPYCQPYRCSACTGIGCFAGCFWVMHFATDGRINMIKRVQQNGRLARWQRDETNWKLHTWHAMNGKLFLF